MENTCLGILIICGLLILWELTAISFTNKKVKVAGRVPSQKLGIGLFAVASVVIIFVRWGHGMIQLGAMAAIAAAALLNFAIKNGLSEYGAYINGWSTPYKDMKYYDFEAQQGDDVKLRLVGYRKEINLLYTNAQVGEVAAMLIKHEVYDMETYTALKRKQEQEKAKAKQSRKR